MPRQLLRRGPAAPPATPPTATGALQQQPPPLPPPAATATPTFATPPGFPHDVELLAAANPAWQRQQQVQLQQQQRQQQQQQQQFAQVPRPRFDAIAETVMPELGEETDVENDRGDDQNRTAVFDALLEGGDEDDDDLDEELDEEEVDEDEEEENEDMREQQRSPSPLPPDLREISSLASWTVSTHKPGCGVAALRNPSPLQFWQSDGPQPHTLTLHFFKLVAIVKIRVYLDFDLDESYTPTKMLFFAGMGGNDMVEFASWEGESPAGWVNIPLDGVGGRNRKRDYGGATNNRRQTLQRGNDLVDDDNLADETHAHYYDDDDNEYYDESEDPYSGNILKAMVVQVRICENHQNGKDTHVRGFQVFAHDDDRRRVAAAAAASAAAAAPTTASGEAAESGYKQKSMHRPIRNNAFDSADEGLAEGFYGLDEPDWMGEPVIR